jgi:hypothetical protein
MIGFFSDEASVVVTNLPGRRQRLTLAGVPIESVLARSRLRKGAGGPLRRATAGHH